jgi:hypothetical protein
VQAREANCVPRGSTNARGEAAMKDRADNETDSRDAQDEVVDLAECRSNEWRKKTVKT